MHRTAVPKRLAAATLALFAGCSAVLAEIPTVVVSIAPLHSLVADVMAGMGEPHLLVGSDTSEHTYSMRPSDARALANADLVVWIGPNFERFLTKSIANSAARLVTLAEEPRLTLLAARAGGAWASHDDHDDLGYDGHLWLDPTNAIAIAGVVADALAAIDPANATAYRANGARLSARLWDLDAELADALRPFADRPFIVFHDAYRYFEQRYGLRGIGSILVDAERPPSAQTMVELRATIKTLGAICVFAEPQYDPGLVATLVDGTDGRPGLLDPLGGADYEGLMRGLASSLLACLDP